MLECEYVDLEVISSRRLQVKARKWMELSKKCLKKAKEGALGKTNFEAFQMRSICRK